MVRHYDRSSPEVLSKLCSEPPDAFQVDFSGVRGAELAVVVTDNEPLRRDSGRLVVEHFAQSWRRKIQESTQLQRHLPLTRVNQTQRTQRRFELFQHYA